MKFPSASADAPTPIIIDTDIGMDADDVWALALALRSPELDVRLILSTCGDTVHNAALAAKLLEVAGRTDVPLGIGIPLTTTPKTHSAWLGDYQLDDYPGGVATDGIGALFETIMTSAEPVAIVGIGPLPNIAAALAREPRIAERARFIGMHGSLRRGYLGASRPHKEYNVKAYPQAAQQVFGAPWDITITPLDTCGNIILRDTQLARLRGSTDPLVQSVLACQDAWVDALGSTLFKDLDLTTQTTPLYDTVAIYLAFSERLLQMEKLPVAITDDGKTLIEPGARMINCATEWEDQTAFEELLVTRLLEERL